MSQILGIDAGNTMIKAVLFDLSGRVLSVAECAGETHQPQEGYAERPVEDIWRGVSNAVSRCLQQAGTRGSEVIASRGRRTRQRVVCAGSSAAPAVWHPVD
jgi:Sugar (pentulose and hexulose) kinases